ncbi:MAG: FAD-dependent oxidoreductase [Cyanobacteriota/Melainabacteria group bacterium]
MPEADTELSKERILVLGAGISGLSTAILLQARGYRVTILAEYRALNQKLLPDNPLVPTDYAMASAYPHNLKVENLNKISADSQRIFRNLERQNFAGLHRYRIYEVFEVNNPADSPASPPLNEHRINFEKFSGEEHDLKAAGLNVPARSDAGILQGWRFDSYFVDMPVYMQELWRTFEVNGGLYQEKIIDRDFIEKLPAGTRAVNCLGLGSVDLFNDKSECLIMRGSQLIVEGAPMVKDEDGMPLAYNYTPTRELYQRADGRPEYLHFFPREDGWILGQTREPGRLDEDNNFIGEEVIGNRFKQDGCLIPLAILHLNHEILYNWQGISVEERKTVARVGYRYYRDPEKTGVRLEVDSDLAAKDITLVHNYGHGGSGITMSWGCSAKAVSLMEKHDATDSNAHSVPAPLDKILNGIEI